jgi:hypothetical protein
MKNDILGSLNIFSALTRFPQHLQRIDRIEALD